MRATTGSTHAFPPATTAPPAPPRVGGEAGRARGAPDALEGNAARHGGDVAEAAGGRGAGERRRMLRGAQPCEMKALEHLVKLAG